MVEGSHLLCHISSPAIVLKVVYSWYGVSHIMHGVNLEVMPG